MSKKKIFLIDGMAIIYRAHFAMIKNPKKDLIHKPYSLSAKKS